MRSIATVTGSCSTGGPDGSPDGAGTSRAARRRDERSTMGETPRPGHDCTAYPAVRDPEWVESSFGHK